VTVRRACRFCNRRTAITPTGRYWTHGRPECPGSRKPASYNPAAYWPKHHRGRRVVTIPGPDTWNLKETAA